MSRRGMRVGDAAEALEAYLIDEFEGRPVPEVRVFQTPDNEDTTGVCVYRPREGKAYDLHGKEMKDYRWYLARRRLLGRMRRWSRSLGNCMRRALAALSTRPRRGGASSTSS